MTEEARRTALHAWRIEEVRSGNVDSQLPSVADLDRIAKLSESSREALRALPLRRKVAEQFVGPILEVLREVDGPGARAGASGRGAAAREGTVAPAGEAARRGAPPTAAPRDESAVEPEGFAPLDLSRGLADEAAQLVSATVADEAVRLSWPARPGHTVLYRVVAEDGGRKPFSPDSGMAVGATRTTHVLDSRPMTEAVRWVQVWAYEGSSVAAAKAAQPVLHAAGAVVAPVADVQLKESQGIVSAAWRAARGTERVAVLRIPAAEAGVAGYAPRYQLPDIGGNLGGFVDDTPVSGAEYEYRFFAMSTIDGRLMASPPSIHRVTVAAPALPVSDLAVGRREDRDDVVDLSWTPPPTGEVRLFRTERPPAAGIEAEDLPLDALAQAGLTEQARLTFPVMAFEGRAYVAGVPWPADSNRAYFTPVTVRDRIARVGRTVVLTRTAPLVEPRLVQRVSHQLLTFGWPADAAEVRVYVTGPGVPPPARLEQSLAVVTEAEYVDRGGLRLEPGVLNNRGCDIHLVPVSWDAGTPVPGEPATLRYAGLMCVRYRLTTAGGSLLGGFTRGLGKRTLEMQADARADLPVVLVVNQERLPLHPRDGEVVLREVVRFAPGEWQIVSEFNLERAQRGYLRLFADVAADVPVDIAVLDPPLSTLRR